MTGFGLGKTQSAQSVIEVSLRAVNGRFLEPRFHLPREFIPFEPELKKILQKSFDRGTIDIFVSHVGSDPAFLQKWWLTNLCSKNMCPPTK